MTISIQEKKLEGRVSLLTIENEILKERLAFIENIYSPRLWMPSEWGFSTKETKLIGVLYGAKGRILTKDQLHTLVYQDIYGQDMPHDKIVDVHVFNIRKKIRDGALAIEIKTGWGEGYSLTKESCQFLSRCAVSDDLADYREFKSRQKRVS